MLDRRPDIHAAAATEQQPLLAPDASHNDAPKDISPSIVLDLPESITLRVWAAMFSFFIMGVQTAGFGALIPYMEPYYAISDTLISLVFVVPLAGYLVASVMNNAVHRRFGRRGIAVVGAVCQLLVNVVAACHPPYVVFLLAYIAAGYGTGLIDAGWCAWAGGLRNANTVSGFLHGAYSFGATVGPYLTTFLVDGLGWPWYSFYWAMVLALGIEVLILPWAFRHDDGVKYRSEKAQAQDPSPEGGVRKVIWRHKVLWLCAAYLICYVGAEGTVAGWIVTFMLRIRSASPLAASTCASGFWAGMALGRISLGTLTDRFGERLSVTVYLLGALISQVIFSLMTPIVVSVVSITMLGFLLGPLYPTGIVMVTRLMPRELHVSAVATVAAAGQIGNAVFPFILGAAAERLGIQALQPFVFGLLALALAVWWCFPRLPARMVRTQGIEAETAGIYLPT